MRWAIWVELRLLSGEEVADGLLVFNCHRLLAHDHVAVLLIAHEQVL